jgi:hypothetical protein
VGQGKQHGHGETFGHGNDEHDQGDDDVSHELVHEDFTANFVISSSLDEEYTDGDGEDDERAEQANELQATSNVVQLVGEFSLVLCDVENRIIDATLSVLADAANYGLTGASNDEGVSHEEWSIHVLAILSPCEFCLFLLVHPRVGLFDTQVGRLDDEAVSWHLVSRAHLNNISHNQVPNRRGLHGAKLSTENGQVLISVQALELDEFAILVVVIVGANEDLQDECG